MKKLITTLFSLFLFLGLSAQTGQGSFMIGANTNLNITSQSILDIEGLESDQIPDDVQTDTKLELNAGVFIIDNFLLGVGLNYNATKVEVPDYDDYETDNMSYGAFLRYYIGGLFFVGGQYAMVTSSDWDDIDDEYKPNVSALSGEAGFSIFLNDNVAFIPKAQYTVESTTQNDITAQVAYLSITAGLAIHF